MNSRRIRFCVKDETLPPRRLVLVESFGLVRCSSLSGVCDSGGGRLSRAGMWGCRDLLKGGGHNIKLLPSLPALAMFLTTFIMKP